MVPKAIVLILCSRKFMDKAIVHDRCPERPLSVIASTIILTLLQVPHWEQIEGMEFLAPLALRPLIRQFFAQGRLPCPWISCQEYAAYLFLWIARLDAAFLKEVF